MIAIEPALDTELGLSLGRVQSALEALPEYPEQCGMHLDTLSRELRGLRGAYAVIGNRNAECCARDMLALLDSLSGSRPSDRACAALDDAALLLKASVDRPIDDLSLLTVLHALDRAREVPLLDDGDRFAARAAAAGWPAAIPREGLAAAGEPADVLARRELTAFQTALLAWFRKPSTDEALQRIAAIADLIADAAADDRLCALWRAHAALADSLIGRQAAALDTRRLLGRAGSQLKRLADSGEAAAIAQAGDTVWRLLHALQSATTGKAARLRAQLLPDATDTRPPVNADRDSRAAVLAELQGEFAAIKDAVDLRLRSSGAAVDLGPTASRIERTASVIGLLGLSESARELRETAQALAAAPATTAVGAWLPGARVLLRIELGLEAALLGHAPLDDRRLPHHALQREARAAIFRELLIDCARLKAGFEKAEREGDGDARASLPALLQALAGALRVLGADDVAAAAATLAGHGAAPGFAAALVCLETWLETERDAAGHGPPLAAELARQVAGLARVPQETARGGRVSPAAGTDDDAAELRALFLDEVAEVQTAIDALRPSFQRDPARGDTLAAFRRAFHTLKGSGRTVGADAIGALGAAVEHLLGRCADGAIAPSRALITVVDDALQALPALIAAYRIGAAAFDADTTALIERAERVASGRQAAEVDVRAVFCSDARARLDGVRQWLASRDRSAPAYVVDDRLSRSFHTLRGSAAVVNAVALSRLAGLIEAAFDALQQADAALPAAGLPLLDELVDQIEAWIAAVADDTPVPETAAEPWAARLAALQPPPAAPLPPSEPEPAVAPAVAPEAAADAGAVAEVPEVDAELQDIFIGEAQELLDALAAASGLWGGSADDARSLGSLRRGLHTLKGSARMAAASAIGAVAHRLETLLEHPDAHPAATLVAAFDAGLDALQAQLDALRQGRQLPAGPVLAAIDAALGLPPSPSPVPPAAAVAPVAEVPAAAIAKPEALVAPPAPAGDPVPPPIEPAPVGGGLREWLPGLFARPEAADSDASPGRRETARVPVERLDAMLNQAGEIAIARAQLDEHHAAVKAQLAEATQTIARIREQLRQMDIATEAQISARSGSHAAAQAATEDRYAAEFDALELDRYSRMQELSRALAESVGDLVSLHGSMEEALGSADALLIQQGRQTTELQQGLMGTLMVPFSRQEQRLSRVVRQTALENGRDVEPVYIGADAELDRNVLERMTAPLEHLLRNAVVHGIEAPEARVAAGKPARGSIEIRLANEGSQLVVEVADDGRGLDHDAIRRKAIERGLMSGRVELAPEALARFIFEPGFSTADRLTQDAGRGIGMDVVANQVRQLGGTLELRSEAGRGARFIIRLPLTLAVSQALLVGVGSETFAIPLAAIEGVGRLPRRQADALLATRGGRFHFGGDDWHLRHLADFVDLPRPAGDSRHVNALLVRLGPGQAADGERLQALVVDRLIGSREIVSKAAGPQLGTVVGIGGATILADGRVAMILDLPALIADRERRALLADPARSSDLRAPDARMTIMVVDDSVTVRRIAERLLLRHGYRVLTARDGVDAMAQLHAETPDAVLLDIEMPRADGFEVAAFIRQHATLRSLPIVMVTSRSGEKHRARARQLGVDGYLTKPWQDEQLLATLRTLPGFRQ